MEEKKSNTAIETLMSRRTLVLEGEITNDKTTELATRFITLQAKSNDTINLIINSGGGGTVSALTLCDLMNNIITAPIRGIALGWCGSAATFIMLHCNERISTPHSRFLIHSGTIGKINLQIDDSTSQNLESLLRETKSIGEIVTRLYMNRLTPVSWKVKKPTLNKKKEFVKKLLSRGDQQFDEWLTPEEAINIGLIDKISRQKFDIF